MLQIYGFNISIFVFSVLEVVFQIVCSGWNGCIWELTFMHLILLKEHFLRWLQVCEPWTQICDKWDRREWEEHNIVRYGKRLSQESIKKWTRDTSNPHADTKGWRCIREKFSGMRQWWWFNTNLGRKTNNTHQSKPLTDLFGKTCNYIPKNSN